MHSIDKAGVIVVLGAIFFIVVLILGIVIVDAFANNETLNCHASQQAVLQDRGEDGMTHWICATP